MKGAWRIARVTDIDLNVHWSFSLIILLVIWQGVSSGREPAGILFILAALISVFICVTLHELGHAWVARRLNVFVKSVTLLPVGGVTQMESAPTKPHHELLIAAGGPLVNLGVSVGLSVALLIIAPNLFYGFVAGPRVMIDAIFLQAPFWQGPALGLLIFLIFANAVLFIFNLIPILPLDGGRILRAGLAMALPPVRATQLTIGLGQIFFLALLVAAYRLRSFGLFAVAIFVFLASLPVLVGGRRRRGVAGRVERVDYR